MKRFHLRSFALFVIVGLTAVLAVGQSLPSQPQPKSWKGKVKLETFSREYWMVGGRPVPSKAEVVSQTEYDRDGRTVRDSDYGNIERRYIYTYPDGKQTVEIQYYDSAGKRISTDRAAFEPRADLPFVGDLCSGYSTRIERDKKAGIERSIQACPSGSIRSTTITESNAEFGQFREFREDAKGRTYEYVSIWGDRDDPKELRATINDLKSPKYTWSITYVNHKFDAVGNLVESGASAIHSSKPNQVWFQYVEKYAFEYFE
jgi:hypothetical protein